MASEPLTFTADDLRRVESMAEVARAAQPGDITALWSSENDYRWLVAKVLATLDRDRADLTRLRAIEAAARDVSEGLTAEMVGVESAIQTALDRAQKVTRTLAALATPAALDSAPRQETPLEGDSDFDATATDYRRGSPQADSRDTEAAGEQETTVRNAWGVRGTGAFEAAPPSPPEKESR